MTPARPVVLAVDDELMLLTTFARILRQHFDVRIASSGPEALACIQRERPDILICDYAMPGMNGLELLSRVAAQDPTIVRILSTAHATAPEVAEARAEGLFGELVEKPWIRDVVVAAIGRARQAAARLP